MCREIDKLDMSETKGKQSEDEHASPAAKVIDAMGNEVIRVDMDEEIAFRKGCL